MNQRLVDKVRASLGLDIGSASSATPEQPSPAPVPARAPARRTARLAELRREIARIEGRWHRPPDWLPAQAPVVAPTRLPDVAVETFYREVYGYAYRFGRERLPQREHLDEVVQAIESYLRLSGQWSEDAQPLQPADLLFIDTETTGLSRAAGTIAFLVGVGRYQDGADDTSSGFVVDQLLLGDPGQEPEALDRLRGYLEKARVLVSYNGKGFDLPVLRTRAVLWRVPLPLDHPHVDLLPLCRRVFGARTSNCRLTTIEREILGFVRQGDVDGAEVPGIYVEYLRTGRTDELQRVLEHNRLDVATMAPIATLAAFHLVDPLRWAEDAEELLALGALHLSWGAVALAEKCYERGLELSRPGRTRRRLLARLARLRRRRGDREGACSLWEQHVEQFPRHNTGWIELAKYHEHVTRDLDLALSYAERAPHPELDEIPHRLARLRRRIERRASISGLELARPHVDGLE